MAISIYTDLLVGVEVHLYRCCLLHGRLLLSHFLFCFLRKDDGQRRVLE